MMAGPASNMDVKRHNRSNTLRCILTCDRISQMELSQRLGLSWPTVLQNVKELTELGLSGRSTPMSPPAGERPKPTPRCGTRSWRWDSISPGTM